MNQLEHLRALRDKARIQTEQAKAVLKQQGEITESLDRLIAALEGKEHFDFSSRKESLSLARGVSMADVAGHIPEREGGHLVQMIANLDKKNGESAPVNSPNHNQIVWVDEVVPVLPPIKKNSPSRALPKLEPIVWEVANVQGYPASTGSAEVKTSPVEGESDEEAPVGEEVIMQEQVVITEDLFITDDGARFEQVVISEEVTIAKIPAPAVPIVAAATEGLAGVAAVGPAVLHALKSNEEMGVKFKFLKFGAQNEEKPVAVPVHPKSEFKAEDRQDFTAPVMVGGVSGGTILSDSEVPVPPVAEIKNDFSFVVAKDEPVKAEVVAQPLKAPLVIPELTSAKAETNLYTDETVPISPSLMINPAAQGISVKLNEATAPVVLPAVAEEVVKVNEATAPVVLPAVEAVVQPSIPAPRVVSSNIFFDANSAYLKESELTKLQAIAAAVSGSEARAVKIQGLEDLASSNDFKILLASRRVLAVKKKLAEKGVGTSQVSVNEIRLSDDGRVLDPASISIMPV